MDVGWSSLALLECLSLLPENIVFSIEQIETTRLRKLLAPYNPIVCNYQILSLLLSSYKSSLVPKHITESLSKSHKIEI
ncbi:hypothetical protein ES332_D02G093100v1 [Gossypium tomentosum]|uniref:Uncharacterized protein n=1 Tax=Gossypium tomentosum TaxID=34277 RepID=A0A5D2LV11_GOSTO|nr:hypothetical protein ES332_D02G093100v1 [Gossypium tomentosum]